MTVTLFGGGYEDNVRNVLGAGLAALWPLNERSGTTAYDISGNALHGTYTGVTLAQLATPMGGMCPLWDGLTNRLNIYSAGLNTRLGVWSEGAITLWMAPANAGVWSDATTRRIFYMDASAPTSAITINKTTTANQLRVARSANGGASIQALNSSASFTALTPVTLSFSTAGNALKLYQSGVQVGATQTGVVGWTGNLAAATCNIGCYDSTPSQIWSGYIAWVSLSTIYPTDAQVAALHSVS